MAERVPEADAGTTREGSDERDRVPAAGPEERLRERCCGGLADGLKSATAAVTETATAFARGARPAAPDVASPSVAAGAAAGGDGAGSDFFSSATRKDRAVATVSPLKVEPNQWAARTISSRKCETTTKNQLRRASEASLKLSAGTSAGMSMFSSKSTYRSPAYLLICSCSCWSA